MCDLISLLCLLPNIVWMGCAVLLDARARPSDATVRPPVRLIVDTLAGRAFAIAKNGSTAPLMLDARDQAGGRRQVIGNFNRGRSGISINPTAAASVQPLADASCSQYPVINPKAARFASIL